MSNTPENEVIVYSKPSCVQCDATTRAMDRKGIEYKKVDVTEDQDAYDRIVGLGYRQVPVVEAGGSHWAGFRPDKIAQFEAHVQEPSPAEDAPAP